MDRLVWIGPAYAAQDHKHTFLQQGFEVVEFTSAESALEATRDVKLAAVIVAADWVDAPSAIAAILAARPAVKVLAATKLGLPPHVRLALEAGASHLIDLKEASHDTALLLRRAVEEHRRAVHQRELLERLHELNEGFLKAMLRETKRNIELEQQLTSDTEEDAAEPGAPRILVVDDELPITELVAMILEPLGCVITKQTSSKLALDLVRRQVFDLVISDKNMPEMDGLELLREVKKLRPGVATILITGFASKESAIEALRSGASAYLEKPFEDIDDVVKIVGAVLAKHKDERKKRDYLSAFKERNRDFLEEYKKIRAELEAWIGRTSDNEGTPR